MNAKDRQSHREPRDGPPEQVPKIDDRGDAAEALKGSWEAVVAEMRPMLVRLAWAVCRDWTAADDAVQEACRVLTERGGEVPPGQLPGWLVRTVQLQAQNQRRKLSRSRGESHAVLSEWYPVAEEHPVDPLVRREELQAVQAAMERLPEEQRQVVHLRIREGRTFAQIASELGIPLGTVLSRMRLAMEKLRRDLVERDDPS
ncbi:MAG: RNA polymerase sigma factor [Planctomycetota bacterium]|nr:MAG: RNA polymerase sigma factor [Planctomycetota bacterium]